MKKKLLASAAMAIAIGCTAAVAQQGSQGTGAGMSQSPGSAEHRGTGGAMRHDQATTGGSAARNQAIPDKQGMGPPKGTAQNQERGSSTRQRGAEENSMQRGGHDNNMQRGAERNNGTNMQRGAEKNKGPNMQRGAERNNGTNPQRGVERNNGTNMQRGAEENNRTTNTQRGVERNNRTNMQRGAEENNRTNTQRGVERNNGTTMQRGVEENSRTNMQRGAQENERGGTIRENRENNAQIQERGGRAGGSVQLSESQRTRIKSLIVKDHNAPHVNSSSFSVAVGSAVPHSVHVAPLPADVIRVVPQYRGFDYVVVRDQLLIIDPDTMKIVAILPA